MGRRGPPPQPGALLRLAGNPGGRPIPPELPHPPGLPEPPDWLDDRSIAIWRQLIPKLSTLGLAKQVHAQVLARYCELLVLWVDCVTFVRKNGRSYAVRGNPTTVAGSDGKPKEKPGRILGFRKFPEVDTMIKLHKELLIIEREFGGTPAAETRVNIEIERAAKGDVGDIKSRFFAPPQSRNAAS